MKYIYNILTVLLGVLVFSQTSLADYPITENGITRVHLNQYNGYFAAKETLGGLKAGKYEFVVTNKANKLVGFQIQNYKTKETLDMFPLEPGESRTSTVEVTTDGIRYRCPINPTAWYDLDGIKAVE